MTRREEIRARLAELDAAIASRKAIPNKLSHRGERNLADEAISDAEVACSNPDDLRCLLAELERVEGEAKKADYLIGDLMAQRQIAERERDQARAHGREVQAVVEDVARERDQAQAALAIAREALPLCAAHAGHPDPAEGCRLVIASASEALRRMGEE